MKVKLKVERQVYGKPVQKPGEIIDVSEEEGRRLIAVNQAEPANEKDGDK